MILIYTTCKNKQEAEKIAKHLLEKRLVACAVDFPAGSSYWWNEKIENSREQILLLKTKDENFMQTKEEIKKIHSYETPCILKLNVEANEEYENWLNKEVKNEKSN